MFRTVSDFAPLECSRTLSQSRTTRPNSLGRVEPALLDDRVRFKARQGARLELRG